MCILRFRLRAFGRFVCSVLLGVLSVYLNLNCVNNSLGADDLITEHENVTFFVSPIGNDSWSGTLANPNSDMTDGPFLSLERARLAVRDYKASLLKPETIVVEVGAGVYNITKPFVLNQEDSGFDEEHPVIWRASNRHSKTILNGGVFLYGAKMVDDQYALSRLKPEVIEHILVFDVSDQIYGNLGAADNGPELFYQGKPMRVARYPDDDFIKIVGLQKEGTNEVDIRGTKGIVEGVFFFDDNELLSCVEEKDLWVSGYWFWDWSQQNHKVVDIDVDKKMLTVAKPYHSYGYRNGQWFYVFNALCKLDSPGEYYIDRETKKLYVYPFNENWKEGDFLLTKTKTIIELQNVQNLVLSGFNLFGSRGDVIRSKEQVQNVTIEKCDISNSSGNGISLNGLICTIAECELWNLGCGGISVSGGDRQTLSPGKNKIIENYVHDYARIKRVYAPGITVSGVGNYIGHNLIENAPHMGMGFSGNEHTIEYNEIGNVCKESNDAGAIYTGRDWTMRGNVLRYNYLHDIQGFRNRGCVGIYLDDMFSSADIVSNLFVNVTRAAFIGGGRDSKINGNVFVNCNPAVHIDARGDGWANGHIQNWLREVQEKGTLSGIRYDEAPYSERYPELASIFDEGKSPALPEGNEVLNNICIGGYWDVNKRGQWLGASIEEKARPLLKMDRNFVSEMDPTYFFVDVEKGDYRLKEDSQLIREGYISLPVSNMGLTSNYMKKKVSDRKIRN